MVITVVYSMGFSQRIAMTRRSLADFEKSMRARHYTDIKFELTGATSTTVIFRATTPSSDHCLIIQAIEHVLGICKTDRFIPKGTR